MAIWDKITSSGDVEDRRGMAPIAFGGASFVGIAVLLFNLFTGGQVNVGEVLQQLQNVQVQQQQNVNKAEFEGADSYEVFASKVLGSTNDMWINIFNKLGKTYNPPKLVLFRTATRSSCGNATSSVGPHYCPADNTIYLDETFFEELTKQLGAQGGDVAEAYVIAHEAAHHVQNELGIMDQVHSASSGEENELSIKLELQADCFAGLWANSIKDLGVFEPGEINEAIDAAAAVGDDRIQEKVNGQINPETWTHGSAADRVKWFNVGFEQGSLQACDTFR